VAQNKVNLVDFIEESFGSNAKYVEGLLERYQTDPNSSTNRGRSISPIFLNGGASPQSADRQQEAVKEKQPQAEAKSAPKPAAVAITPDIKTKPITGPAKKIVENMEQSLTVPTATSFRNIPVKVLDENRRIINEHLAVQGRGKVSFTHIIAWAIVQAVKVYPHLNVGFGMVDGRGVPART
jgi:pyruvate/2-oxoglutarate dehydrogenase complex dihydrolipoamide acyltransferase (E2) component